MPAMPQNPYSTSILPPDRFVRSSDLDKETSTVCQCRPDGRWILYTQSTGAEGNSDIMLVEHFR